MNNLGSRLEAAFAKMLEGMIKKVPDLVVAFALFALFLIAALIVRRAVRGALNRSRMDRNVGALMTRLAYYTVLLVGVLQALSQLNVNLAALGIGVGALGFAAGFAFKDILSNFLAGMLILWTHHFSNGDQIRIRDYEGTVEAIGMRGTILRTYDGRRVTIPNSDVYTNAVVNNTFYRHRRSSIFVSVVYDTDFAEAERAIRASLSELSDVLTEPQPDVLVKQLGDYAVQLEVRIWTAAEQINVLTVNSDAAKAVKAALDKAGIQMPIPTQVVELRNITPD